MRSTYSSLPAAARWVVVLVFACSTAVQARQPPPNVVAVTPVDGARLVRPTTGIQLRLDRALAPGQLAVSAPLAVTGSRSGPHSGHVHPSMDGTVLLFDPDTPFAMGERVDVTLSETSGIGRGIIGGGAFGFTIAPGAVTTTFKPSEFEWPRPGNAPSPAWSGRGFPLPGAVRNPLPPEFPAIQTSVYDSTGAGYLFLANMPIGAPSTPFLLMLQNDGTPVWYRELAAYATDFKVQPNDQLTYYDLNAEVFRALDHDYDVVDTWACGNGYWADVHECRILPNGHALLLAYDLEPVDMSQVVEGGDSTALVYGLIIQELDPLKNVVFQWRSWDHFQITDATHEDLTAHVIDYVHGNALELDNDGNLLLSSRHMDEITKIDHTTGDIVWRWGGKHNQFAFVGDTLPFSHQHAIRRIANGDVTLFDNGNYHDPPFSRACEYQLDETNFTATMVWQYRNDPDSYGWAMGYVQRLDNGNTLIGFGMGKPDVIEVGPDLTKKMELWLPTGVSSYRAYRSAWALPAAGVPTLDPGGFQLMFLASNPLRGATTLFANLPGRAKVTVGLYDLQGRLVQSLLDHAERERGVIVLPLNLAGRPAGVYLCRVQAGDAVRTRKLVYAP